MRIDLPLLNPKKGFFELDDPKIYEKTTVKTKLQNATKQLQNANALLAFKEGMKGMKMERTFFDFYTPGMIKVRT